MSSITTPAAAAGTAYQVDPMHSTVEFVVRHLMISKVRGRFTAVAGTIDLPPGATVPTAIDVTIQAASIDTREEQRDGHLKSPDFFDVATYPELTYKSTGIEGSGESFRVHGDLTLHGVTRNVDLDVSFEGRAKDQFGFSRAGFEAHGKLSRKDFGLTWNAAVETGGVAVGDEVKIELNIEAIAPQAAA